MSINLRKVLEYEKNRVVFFNYPGCIFYISPGIYWLADAQVRRYGISHPYSMMFIRNGEAKGEISVEAGLGDWVMGQLTKQKEKFLQNHRKEVSRQIERINLWLSKHSPDSIADNLVDLCQTLQVATRLLIEVNLTFHIAITVDKHFENKKKELLSKYNISFSPEDLAELSISRQPSAVMIHENSLLRLVTFLKAHNRLNFSLKEARDDITTAKLIDKCYRTGYFLHSGYGGVKIWTPLDEWKIIQKAKKELQQLTEQARKRKRNQMLFRQITAKRKFPKDMDFWFETFRYFSYLRDMRKTVQQKMFYWQAVCLEKIAAAVGIPRKQLEKLEFTEFITATFNNKKELKQTLTEREQAYLWLWTPKSGHRRWQGYGAKKVYDQYSLQVRELSAHNDKTQLKGTVASPGKVSGRVQIIFNPRRASYFTEGSILVTGMTSPDFVPLMKRSAAIITELGGITCHAAIISRELGKPCIIGVKNATSILKNGNVVEVDALQGVIKIIQSNN